MTLMRCGCLILLMLAMVGSLSAQNNDRRRFTSDVFNKGSRVKDEASSSLWRFGSFHISPVIGLEQLGYDSNVFSTETGEVNDFNISPELGLRTFLRINPSVYWANHVTYNYVYYADQSQLRGSEYSGETRVYGIFKKTYFELGAKYRRDRQRVNSEVEERVYTEKLNVDAQLVLNPVPRGFLILKPSLYTLSFDNRDLVQAGNTNTALSLGALERDETAMELSYVYKLQPQFWPFVELHRDSYDFKNPAVGELLNPRDDSDRSAVFLGARNEYDRRLHYNFKFGFETLSFNSYGYDPASPALDEDLFSAQGFVSYKLSRRFDIEADGHNLPFFSFNREYGYYESRRLTLGVGYRISGKYRVGPEVVVGENDYTNAFFDTPVDQLRNDKISAFNMTARIPFGKDLEWQITAGFMKRDSNLAGQSDEGLNIASEVVYKLDSPRKN